MATLSAQLALSEMFSQIAFPRLTAISAAFFMVPVILSIPLITASRLSFFPMLPTLLLSLSVLSLASSAPASSCLNAVEFSSIAVFA